MTTSRWHKQILKLHLTLLLVSAGCVERLAVFDVDVHVPPLSVAEDRDQDGVVDSDERIIGTAEDDPDTDGDGLWDGDELRIGTDPLYEDTDLDNLLDNEEVLLQTDPTNPDTDGGGAVDGDEVLTGTDPFNALDDGIVPTGRRFAGGGGCVQGGGSALGWLVTLNVLLALGKRVRRC